MKVTQNIITIIALSIFLQSCNQEQTDYCPDINPVVTTDSSYWQGLEQNLVYSSSNNHVAIACHNCYANNSANVFDTELIIESAINNNADIVELDVVFPVGNYVEPMVSHELNSASVRLSEVLATPLLLQSTTSIFLELKGNVEDKQLIRDVLDTLMQFKRSASTFNYFNQERIIAFRSFELYSTLLNVRSVLSEEKYMSIAPFVKLNRLHYFKKSDALFAEVQESYQCGMNMVELDYRSGIGPISALNEYAKSLGLGVSVFTLNESNFEEAIVSLKDSVDVFTISTENQSKLSQGLDSILLRARVLINGQ